MTAIAPSSPWIPEDDLLLKNSIEAGASLEALAKGAVHFSRRFTFQELQDRWHSLLYDPDISAQASARMGELQGSASNHSSEINRSDKAIQSKMVHKKRRIGSIRKQYYSMRKRLRSEFFSSVELGFLAEPNVHNCIGNGVNFHEHVMLDNGPPVGNSTPNYFGLQETDFDILHQAFPQTMNGIAASNVVANISDGFHSDDPDALADNQISRVARDDCFHGFPRDVSSFTVQDSLRNIGAECFEHKDTPQSVEDKLVEIAKCSGVEEVRSSQPLPDTNLFETDDSEAKPLATFDPTNDNLQNACSEFGGTQHLNSPNSDGRASFHTMGFSPLLPGMPLWKTMEDLSTPAMPVDVSPRDKRRRAEDVSALPDNDNNKIQDSPGHGDVHSGPTLTDRRSSDGFINSTALSDGEFADLSDTLLDFSNEDDILFMDVDGNDTVDKSCYDGSLLLSSPMDANEGDAPKVVPKKMTNTGFATTSSAYPADSEVLTSQLHSVHGDPQSVFRSGVSMPSTSVLNTKLLEINLGNTYCTLNTEDPEIPCNDDIFLLIHPAASLAFSPTRPIARNAIEPSSSADEKDTGQGVNYMKKGEDTAQFFVPSQMVGPYMSPATGPKHALVGCTVKSELPDANMAIGVPQCKSAHTHSNTSADVKLESIITKVEYGVVDTPGTFGEIPLHAEAGSIELALPESVVNPSTSDYEEPESDNDVPYFSDIEAMILEMDLGSYDQDSYFSTRVSKYQHEDSKRKIRRLEQCAQSSLQRAMASQGALAILYGRRLKHYIRETKVILGRSTAENDVDIDLGKEGRANKISRRQAIIKMESDGSFFLKNLGKTSISVNGKAVANGQSLGLSSSCLIEIRGMSFIFEMNHKSVRRHLDNIAKKSHLTNFEWSPAVEPEP